MKKIVKCRSTKVIIAESNDCYYYNNKMFPAICIGELQTGNNEEQIRYSFYRDIARKYNLSKKKIGYYLHIYSTEILRSLYVFGEHEYIIDNIRIQEQGSY